ncbi:MAG: hypothetical protein Q3962_01215 [Corynebacterium sp.]|nr:hypothetical protein [Corynebacterium sp.]
MSDHKALMKLLAGSLKAYNAQVQTLLARDNARAFDAATKQHLDHVVHYSNELNTALAQAGIPTKAWRALPIEGMDAVDLFGEWYDAAIDLWEDVYIWVADAGITAVYGQHLLHIFQQLIPNRPDIEQRFLSMLHSKPDYA